MRQPPWTQTRRVATHTVRRWPEHAKPQEWSTPGLVEWSVGETVGETRPVQEWHTMSKEHKHG